MADKPIRPDWETYLMSLACVVSSRSHDPDTRHGCVIVDSKHRILGLGYNGFPRGLNTYPITRPEKYKYVSHSELNAILNCAMRPEGATLYVTGMPCSQCMLAIIQAGIRQVFYGNIGSTLVDEQEEELTKTLAKNHNVVLRSCRVNVVKALQNTIEYLIGKNSLC